ncbi:hypothetical protein LMG29739_04844 [Paraburkholderia solisilvae]|uniref:Uncharacterized protein n=1 Tax=Paraburkholderia solisilvae TaxID=624376 RepID=A0A6J5EML3_9BURK|nr:hypothetical protein LMG29739_04844 [Paraburkholderia solisilvae]
MKNGPKARFNDALAEGMSSMNDRLAGRSGRLRGATHHTTRQNSVRSMQVSAVDLRSEKQSRKPIVRSSYMAVA